MFLKFLYYVHSVSQKILQKSQFNYLTFSQMTFRLNMPGFIIKQLFLTFLYNSRNNYSSVLRMLALTCAAYASFDFYI